MNAANARALRATRASSPQGIDPWPDSAQPAAAGISLAK